MKIKNGNFVTTKTGNEQPTNLNDAVVAYINTRYNDFSNARNRVEETWQEAWSLYLGTPEAIEGQRANYLYRVGESNNDWRHRLSTGKAFEVVETIHGYLMSAIFPNNDWFSVTPQSSGYAELARVVRKYLGNKLYDSRFKSHFSAYLRQLLVTGTSVMALPWRYETKAWKKNVKVNKETESGWKVVEEVRVDKNRPDFEVLDIFDCFVDPWARETNDADFIRRLVKTRAEVIQCISSKYYQGMEPYDVCCLSTYGGNDPESRKRVLRTYQGINTPEPYSLNDNVEVLEYWGDVHLDGVSYHDVCATIVGENLVRFEPNPFWAGKPFIIGSCFETKHTPYSIGVLEPSLGLLHQLNSITNQRLDNLELAVDEMWTLKQDSSLRPEDVWTEPGKVFLVEESDDLQPVQRGARDFVVSYQEASLLESTIDKNSGTGNLISANASRSGERVTAAEIQAVRDAGGNRLSNLHQHIEDTSLLEVLKKTYRSMQQFVKDAEVVRVAGSKPGVWNYYQVGAEQLAYDFTIKPIGAGHVTDDSKYIKDRSEFIALVAGVPEMASRLNYDNLLYDLVQHFSFDDPDSYIKAPEEQPQVPGGVEGQEQEPQNPQDLMYQLGGTALQQSMGDQLSADGGADFMQQILGVGNGTGTAANTPGAVGAPTEPGFAGQ